MSAALLLAVGFAYGAITTLIAVLAVLGWAHRRRPRR